MIGLAFISLWKMWLVILWEFCNEPNQNPSPWPILNKNLLHLCLKIAVVVLNDAINIFFFFLAPARFRPPEGLSNRPKHGKHGTNRFFLLSFSPLLKPLDYIHKGSPEVLFLHLATDSFLRHKGLTIKILLKVLDFSLDPPCPSFCDVA